MKCQVPQISWHGRDPVLSIDFQPFHSDVLRLASGGTDSHVLIWYITCQGNKSIKLECASDLYRHNKAVNVVRFSPKGDILVSGDDDGDMYVWELKEREQMIDLPNDDENLNKEDWYPVKSLRAHLDDIYDLSWSKDGNFLVSSSLDNSAVLWDMQKYTKLHTFTDFKGYVQGVSYDPLNQYIASIGIDRMLRVHDINSKKTACKVSYAPWTYSTEKGTFKARLFHDDTLQSFFRRLTFTPDGELLIVPSGIVEKGDEKTSNACYIFSRHALNKPVIKLPTGDKYTVAVKCNPHLYKLRGVHDSSEKENELSKPMIKLPYRMIFAVAASDSVLLYDTEQVLPFAYVSNIHYTHLTDLSWSPDGLTLVVSSTDGYCSFILFTQEELGEIYIPEEPKESEKTLEITEPTKMDTSEPATPTTKAVGANQNTPNTTPKRIAPARVESAVPTSGAKDENVTPSPKNAKNPYDKKSSKKSPKMMSIKNFFLTPKTQPSKSSCNGDNEASCNAAKNNDDGIEIVSEFIDITGSPKSQSPVNQSPVNQSPMKQSSVKQSSVKQSSVKQSPMKQSPMKQSPMKQSPMKQSPMKQSSVKQSSVKQSSVKQSPVKLSSMKLSPLKVGCNSCRGCINYVTKRILTAEAMKARQALKTAEATEAAEPMEVDENPTDNQEKQPLKSPCGNRKQSKCKVRLDFTDKDQLVANVDDNASDSCEPTTDNKNELKEAPENDWKLELSQDDDVPMKTDPVPPKKKNEVSKDKSTVSSKKSEPSKTATKTDDKNSSETNQRTTRRRVSFVTLSSKTTLKK